MKQAALRQPVRSPGRVPAYQYGAGEMNSLAIAGPARRAVNARRAVFPRAALLAMLVLSVLVTTWAAVSLLDQEARMRAVQTENAELDQQLAAVMGRNQELRSEIERLGRDDYIETVARKQLGLIQPGEIPYMALTNPGPGTAAATPGNSAAPGSDR